MLGTPSPWYSLSRCQRLFIRSLGTSASEEVGHSSGRNFLAAKRMPLWQYCLWIDRNAPRHTSFGIHAPRFLPCANVFLHHSLNHHTESHFYLLTFGNARQSYISYSIFISWMKFEAGMVSITSDIYRWEVMIPELAKGKNEFELIAAWLYAQEYLFSDFDFNFVLKYLARFIPLLSPQKGIVFPLKIKH